jgi:hypothetical protein
MTPNCLPLFLYGISKKSSSLLMMHVFFTMFRLWRWHNLCFSTFRIGGKSFRRKIYFI